MTGESSVVDELPETVVVMGIVLVLVIVLSAGQLVTVSAQDVMMISVVE